MILKHTIRRSRWLKRCGALCAVCSTMVLFANSAKAGGLYLNEFMTPAQGSAGAGAASITEDASSIAHNPAGIAFVEHESLAVGVGGVLSSIEWNSDSSNPLLGDGGDAGGFAPVGSLFYSRPVSEDVALGFGLFSFSAAVLDYDDAWVGRSQATEADIFTLTAAPTIGYQVADWFSLGAMVGATYGKLDFEAQPLGRDVKLDGDDLEFVWSLGALAKVSDQTQIGVTYLSGADLSFDGSLSAGAGSISTSTELKLPPTLRLGISHKFNQTWTGLATIGWDRWSELDQLFVNSSSLPGSGVGLDRNWNDTYHFALGARYQFSDEWRFQAGVAYDTSPVGAADRTADMPIDRQWRYALGATYQWSEALSLTGSVVYADYGDARINQINPAGQSGDYKSNDILFFGLSLVWNWG